MKNVLFVLLISSSLASYGQNSGNAIYLSTSPLKSNEAHAEAHRNEIVVSVSGMLNAKADEYVAFFNIIQVGETTENTNALLMSRIHKFNRAMSVVGIDTARDVHTDIISFLPKYDFNLVGKLFSKSYNEIPDGFEMQKSVIVRFSKASDLDVILTAAVGAEIYDLVKVDYFLRDVRKHYDQLRTQCFEILQSRIKSYETLGVKLEAMKKTFAEDFGTTLPQTRYGQYQAVARPSLDAVKRNTGVGKFRSADVSPSRYYNAVSYGDYDVVINPVIDEPLIQLTYQIQMKFITDYEKNNYMIMGSNGQVQKLDLNQ